MSEEESCAIPPLQFELTFWNDLFMCPFPNCPSTNNTQPPAITTKPLLAIQHLKQVHDIEIINWEKTLCYFQEYIQMLANEEKSGKIGDSEQDAELRQKLQQEKLKEMLDIQQRERQEDMNVPHPCIFCKMTLPDRMTLFQHLESEHSFFPGQIHNLVRINEFFYTLRQKLDQKQCIYCEKVFKDALVLRKHMRKKKHFRVNPRNPLYDQFYIINYSDSDKKWLDIEADDVVNAFDHLVSDPEEEDWEDWDEIAKENDVYCLFDDSSFETLEACYEHLKQDHGFDLHQVLKDHGNIDWFMLDLSLYQAIRYINYLRECTQHLTCQACLLEFESMDALTKHYQTTQHALTFPNSEHKVWTEATYLFPIVSNDPLLTDLDCD